MLVDALAQARVGLVLVGEVSMVALERRGRDLGLQQRVAFAGGQEDPGAGVRGGDLFVFASEREGLAPLVVSEANAGRLTGRRGIS